MRNRLFLGGLLVVICVVNMHAQGRKRSSYGRDKFLEKQVWLGFKMGGILAKAKPVERYSIYQSTTDPTSNTYEKEYRNYNHLGGISGFEFGFTFKGIGVSFQPNFQRQIFSYKTKYQWVDPANIYNILDLKYDQVQKLDYFEFPLILKYELQLFKLRPYVQAGYYYGRLNNAFKEVEVEVSDYASGASNTNTIAHPSSGDKELFIRSSMGLIVGGGASYPIGNIRLALDLHYRHGFNNITSVANRFSNDQFTGSGDVQDDIKLRNFALSLSCLFPMKFLSTNNFRSE